MAIFGHLSGYFFGKFRDKAINIIWRYATPCWPVTDCKMNDLEWPWVAISQNSVFALAVLDSEGSNLKHNYVKTNEDVEPHYRHVRLRSLELLTLTNFLGQITQNIKTIGKTYSAPKITYTRKAHYATKLTFPHFQNVWLRLPTLRESSLNRFPPALHWI